jgi:hypothetical protein
MYCPSCGIQTSSDQKYCRSCGMDLQMISQAVGEHLGQIIEESKARQRKLERWGTVTGLIGVSMLALLLIGFLICLAVSKVAGISIDAFGFDSFAPVVGAIGLCLTISGAGLAGYPSIRKELGKLRPAKLTGKAQTTAELLEANKGEQAPSITERTTNLLEIENSEARLKPKQDVRI